MSKDAFGNCISNSLCTESFNRIEATRSRIIRTWGTLRRRWRRRCHKSSHIWSPHDAASRRSVGPGSSRRAPGSRNSRLFGCVLRHGFSGWSTSNDTVSICNYNVLKLIHEDRSARVVGEHSIKHVQLLGRQCAENIPHLIRSINTSA